MKPAHVDVFVPALADIEPWLATQPREWSILLAGRASLRVLPHLNFLISDKLTGKSQRDTALAMLFTLLRCHVLASVAAITKDQDQKFLAQIAIAALKDVTEARISAFFDTLEAAMQSVSAPDAARAAHLANLARLGAANAAAAQANHAFMQDVETLLAVPEAGKAPLHLIEQPLWPNRVMPDWEGRNWEALSEKLRNLGEDWAIWAEWYGGGIRDGIAFNGLLQGAENGRFLFGLVTEKALKNWASIARIESIRWSFGPARIHGEIKRLTMIVEAEPSSAPAPEPVSRLEPAPVALAEPDPAPVGGLAPEPFPPPLPKDEPALLPASEPVSGTLPEPAPVLKPLPQEPLASLLMRQRALVGSMLSGLPREAPLSTRSALMEYQSELSLRPQNPLHGLLSDMASIVAVDKTSARATAWMTDGFEEAYKRFSDNHTLIMRGFGTL